jgi:hypothetical protein
MFRQLSKVSQTTNRCTLRYATVSCGTVAEVVLHEERPGLERRKDLICDLLALIDQIHDEEMETRRTTNAQMSNAEDQDVTFSLEQTLNLMSTEYRKPKNAYQRSYIPGSFSGDSSLPGDHFPPRCRQI